MAYNEKLAERIRSEFGGVGFLVHGNTPALAPGASVACGVDKDNMIVRVDLDNYENLLKHEHTKIFTMKGNSKPMKGRLMVEPEGCKTVKQVSSWVNEGVEFASTLPPK